MWEIKNGIRPPKLWRGIFSTARRTEKRKAARETKAMMQLARAEETNMSYGDTVDALFENAQTAVAFAEEYTSRPKMRGQMAGIMSVSRKKHGMNPQDWLDIALTITNAVCDCRQPMATVYRVLYGGRAVRRDGEAAQAMAWHLAAYLSADGFARAERITKPEAQIIGLCGAVIRDERLKINLEHSEKRYRLTLDQYARLTGVSRTQFVQSKSWPILFRESRELLVAWRDIAEREITERLSDLGFFG